MSIIVVLSILALLMLLTVVNSKQVARKTALRRLNALEERIESARSVLSRSVTPAALRDPEVRLTYLEMVHYADTRARDLRVEASKLLAEESRLGYWARLEANHTSWIGIDRKARSIGAIVPDAPEDIDLFDRGWS